MKVNMTRETINTVYRVLNNERYGLKYWLEVKLPNGKASPDGKENIEHKLKEVEDALRVFEQIMN